MPKGVYKRGKEKNYGGRPTKKTVELIGKLKAAFEIDANVQEACAFAGISTETYYDWIKKDKKLSDEIDAYRLTPHLRAKRTFMKGVDSDRKAAKDFLERRSKDYIKKEEIDSKVTITWGTTDD